MDIPIGSKSYARLNPHLFGRAGNPLPYGNGAQGVTRPNGERERDLHDQIEALARTRGWLYVHSRMDAPSTIQVGFPDFAIFMPGARTVFLECKRPGGKATPAQLAKLAHARKLGFTAEIVTSLPEVLAAIDHANPTHSA